MSNDLNTINEAVTLTGKREKTVRRRTKELTDSPTQTGLAEITGLNL